MIRTEPGELPGSGSPRVLELGCGFTKTQGAFGVDIIPGSQADLLHDLDVFPYHTFARADVAGRIESAVRAVLACGLRTGDIAMPGEKVIGTRAMGDAVVSALSA